MSEGMSKDGYGIEYFVEHLERIARNAGLSNPKFHVAKGTKKGDNFVGVVYRVEIKGEKNGSEETVYSIVKCPPLDPNHRKVVESRKLFLREIYFYEIILPAFREFLSDFNLEADHMPVFQASCKDEEKELIILEDLNRRGYVMKSRKLLDYPHATAALRGLAKLHAYSFAMRYKRPDILNRIKVVEDSVFTAEKMKEIEDLKQNDPFCDVVAKALANEGEHYLKRFENFRKNFRVFTLESLDGKAIEPYAVINHGDVWTNNVLFKYEEGTSKPIDVCFIDFQLSRYASPVLDVLYMLFTCYPTEIRHKDYERLLLEYHKALSDYLLVFGCNVKTAFPYEVFMDHIKRFGKFAAVMATFILHIFIDDKVKSIDDVINADKLLERMETDDVYRSTIRGTFKDLIDRDYI